MSLHMHQSLGRCAFSALRERLRRQRIVACLVLLCSILTGDGGSVAAQIVVPPADEDIVDADTVSGHAIGLADHFSSADGAAQNWRKPVLRTVVIRGSECPVVEYPEFNYAEYPDLRAPGALALWADSSRCGVGSTLLTERREAWETAQRRSGLASHRIAALAEFDQRLAGHLRVSADEASVSIQLPVVAPGLELGHDRDPESAPFAGLPMADLLVDLCGPPHGAVWRFIDEQRGGELMAISTQRFELAVHGTRVDGPVLSVSYRRGADGTGRALHMVQWTLPRTVELLDPAALGASPTGIAPGSFQACVRRLEERLNERGAIAGSEMRQEGNVVHRVHCDPSRCRHAEFRILGYDGGSMLCWTDPETGDVLSDYVQPWVDDTVYARATAYVPHLGWTQLRRYGQVEIIAANANTCNANSTHVTWANAEGGFSTTESYVCAVPDAQASSDANDLADDTGFMWCPLANSWDACDETSTPNEDSEVWFSPPLDPDLQPWWVLAGDTRSRANMYYHLVWMRDTLGLVGLPRQCQDGIQPGGTQEYIKYTFRAGGGGGGTASPSRCSLVAYDNQTDHEEVNTIYHEYAHILRNSVRTGNNGSDEGEAGYLGQECRIMEYTVAPPYGQSWWERTQHGIAYASQAILTLFQSDWDFDPAWNYWYPAPSGNDILPWDPPNPTAQYGRVLWDLSWNVGWRGFLQYMLADTGLRNPSHDAKGKLDRCMGPYITGFARSDTRRYVTSAGASANDACACYRAGNPCSCTTLPSHRTEREDVAIALGRKGQTWLTYEVDRTFNYWSIELGPFDEQWSDDLTNLWYAGQFIARPAVDFPSNSAVCLRNAPDGDSSQALRLYGTLQDRETDNDQFSFLPGWGETYSFWAYNHTAGTQLRLRIHNRDRTVLVDSSSCAGGASGDACKTDVTFWDANTHHIRVSEISGAAATYTVRVLHKNDDHADYEPEATPLPVSASTLQTGTIDTSTESDWFRVFVPNSARHDLDYLDVRACSTGGAQLEVTLYSAVRNASGRYVAAQILYNQDTGSAAPRGFSTACPANVLNDAQRQWRYDPPGKVPAGWYFVRIRGTGSVGGYRVSAGTDPNASMSGPCGSELIDGMEWADQMYRNVDPINPNRTLRIAGVLRYSSQADWYELDLDSSDMAGRYVTVDVIGLNGYNGDTVYMNPTVELHPDGASDSEYHLGAACPGTSNYILRDLNGGLRECGDANRCATDSGCRPDNSAHIGFRVNRPQTYRLMVRPNSTTTRFLPYHLVLDIKKQHADTAEPALPAWN